MSADALKKVDGQKSWMLKSDQVKACITRRGGHIGPVTFDRKNRAIEPYSVAPWAKEKVDNEMPDILKVLRGDFFCMPFGGNDSPYKDEQHPLHGETANSKWEWGGITKEDGAQTMHLAMDTTVREGHVDKFVRLVDGQNAVYSQHVISGMKGPMTLGHHAMLRFPEREGSGLISTSPFVHGQVFVEPTEDPAKGGYSILKPGAEFSDLAKVPMIDRRHTDVSLYPARKGFEDIVILVSDPKAAMAWTAVSFPEEGYVWFALKDPKVLASTLLWLSNGGRYYQPWSGRHASVLGLEEITGFFHYGLAESARKNVLSEKGFKTSVNLRADRDLVVNYVMAVAPTPEGFGKVASIGRGEEQQVVITDVNGKVVTAAVDAEFVTQGSLRQ